MKEVVYMSQMKAGALLSYLSLFITIVIALTYTPIMIRLLGQSEYGLFALIGSIAAYFSVMDMGLNNTIVRYTARNRALKNKTEESELNGFFLMLYSVIGLLVIVIGTILYYRLTNIFSASLTSLEIEKAKIMIIILIINFSFSFPLAVFGSIMQAYEKFIVVKLVSIARSVSVPLITLPLLFMGFESITMVLVTSLVNISSLIFNVIYSYKNLKINFKFKKIDSKLWKEILGYSFFVFLGVIVDQIYWNTDQFIIGVLTGTIPVAIYAIGMQFIRLYMQFSTSISGLFLPRVSILIANNTSSYKLSEMMIKYGRVQYLVIIFILSGFFLFGHTFINKWAGKEYIEAYYIVLIIMIPLTIPLVQNLGISILYAKNLQKFRSVNLIFIAILNIVITIPLVKLYGVYGAAFATAISLTIGNAIIMNLYYWFKIGINIPLFWKNILKLSVPALGSLAISYGINIFVMSDNLIFYFLKIILFIIIFTSLIWIFGLNKYEKNLFIDILNGAKKVRKRNSGKTN